MLFTFAGPPVRIFVDGEVVLRSFEVDDARSLFELTEACRPYLRQWLPWVDSTKNLDDTKLFVEGSLRQLAANNGFQAGIWRGEDLLGAIGYHRMDWANRAASVGYWLGEAHQGRGTMTKACSALTSHAFSGMGLHRIEIRCAVENRKSRAIPERLGFRNEGLIRDAEWLYDRFVDHVVYGMLETEWHSARTDHR